jgi:hypothetical protein
MALLQRRPMYMKPPCPLSHLHPLALRTQASGPVVAQMESYDPPPTKSPAPVLSDTRAPAPVPDAVSVAASIAADVDALVVHLPLRLRPPLMRHQVHPPTVPLSPYPARILTPSPLLPKSLDRVVCPCLSPRPWIWLSRLLSLCHLPPRRRGSPSLNQSLLRLLRCCRRSCSS